MPDNLAMSSTTRTFVVLAALIVIIAGVKSAESVVVPFLLSVFIATIASTPVFYLTRHRVPLGISITLVTLLIIGLLVGLGALVTQSVNAFLDKLPFYQERIQGLTTDLVALLAPLGVEFNSDVLLSYFDPGTAFEMVGTMLSGLSNALSNGFLILLTVVFILAEASSFPKKLRDVLADPDSSLPYFDRFADNMNRYIGIKTTISVITGLIVTVFLAILGIDFPILWGMLAFLLNYIPTIGSIIAAVPAVLLAIIQLGVGEAAVAAAGFFATNLIMGNAVEPRFMGKGLGLSTLVVFLSLVFWGWMLGPVGMLLSVPLTMTAKIALEANPGTAWIAHLLGPEDEPMPANAYRFDAGGQLDAGEADDQDPDATAAEQR